MTTIDIHSRRKTEMIDVTCAVRKAVRAAAIPSGLAFLFVPHTTAAVTVNENADPDVARDMEMELNKLIPFDDNYRHAEGNSAAHIKSTLVGVGETLIVEDGDLILGTWQGIWFCEFDGPRPRKLHVKVMAG